MNVLKVMEDCAFQMEAPSDFAALIEAKNVVADLINALESALPRLAHNSGCQSIRPTKEWSRLGSISFDNCHCEVKKVKEALAKASP